MRVSLVGAGPGDPGLLTLKGLERLKEADVVIYDRLVSKGVLDYIPKGTRKVYGGKAIGSGGREAQARLNELMLREAEAGRKVVRLKGGDPFLFSRGAEEAEFLREHGVEFEVVPGISSALAVPAYAGIPLTHRAYSSAVTVVAGRDSGSKTKAEWSRIARGSDVIVVLMGVAHLDRVAKKLLAGGMPPETPLAAIIRGTTKRQKTVVSTLGEAMRNGAERLGIEPPAVIVVGRIVSLGPQLRWKPEAPSK